MAQVGAHTGMRWSAEEVGAMFWDDLMLWADEARTIYAETWGLLTSPGGVE